MANDDADLPDFPLDPPSPDAVPTPPAPLPDWAIAVSLGTALLAASGVVSTVPQFSTMFQAFGAELPALTRWFVHYPAFAFAWPLVVGLLAATWRTKRRRLVPLLLLSVLGSLALVALMMFAMYLPIMKLAATV